MTPSFPNASTRYCALLGHPVRHSASPAFQNVALCALGLNWHYLAMEVLPENLPQALEGCKAMGFVGLNLTVPHKEQAFQLADQLEDSARILGSVNTLKFEGLLSQGQWAPVRDWGQETPRQIRTVGYNTDADAILHALQEELGFAPAQSKILLLGAGGAGRVAALRLAAQGVATLYLVNRTRSKAQALLEEIHHHYPLAQIVLDYPPHGQPIDLVLNATSLGLKESDPLPWDASRFSLSQARLAFDLIYRPAMTPFLSQAKQAGCHQANGMSMLLYQGAASLKIWTGQEPPVELMRQALVENIYSTPPQPPSHYV